MVNDNSFYINISRASTFHFSSMSPRIQNILSENDPIQKTCSRSPAEMRDTTTFTFDVFPDKQQAAVENVTRATGDARIRRDQFRSA